MKLIVKKFGMSLGLTFALVYLGCALVVIIAGHEASISFFNTLLHGIDVSSIVRMDMPLWEALLGIVEIFILGWLIGACIAGFYNANLKEK
jgi:uncharacterized protein DUF5676